MAKKTGKLKAKIAFTYTPAGGAPSTIVRTLQAKPPKPKGGKRKGTGKRR